MKKILYNIVALVIMGCAFISCNDDDAPVSRGVPAQDAAGTYTGTWTIFNENTGEEFTYDGSITLSANESKPNVTTLEISCPAGTDESQIIDGKSSVSDITYANTGFIFTNSASAGIKAGDLECTCNGRIDDGVLVLKIVKADLNIFTYETEVRFFSFTGKKN